MHVQQEARLITLDSFTLLEPVARGGMAELWRGVHTATELPVAVKVLSGVRGAVDPSFTRALHAEAAAMAGLRSPFVVRVHDFGVVDAGTARASGGRLMEGTPWIAMEWVGGGTLADRGVVDDWPKLLRVLLDLLGALAHAHARGIIHRDLKPENVLVASREPLGVKLADFGISFARRRWLENLGPRKPTGALTPKFAAPEQVQGAVTAQGPWTDLYLLGCLAWTVVCGAPPFRRRRGAEQLMAAHLLVPAPALRPAFPVPPELDAWVRRLMAKEPGGRFACAADAEAALRAMDPGPRRRGAPSVAPVSIGAGASIGAGVSLGVGAALVAMRGPELVGRWSERDTAWKLLARVVDEGRPRRLVIRGPSGVGTSALAGWLVERAEELGVAFGARGRDDTGLPGLVGRWLGVASGRRSTGLEDAVRAALTTRPGPPPPLEPLVALLDGRGADRATRFETAASALRWRADRTVILWIDGIHDDGELVAFARWLHETRALSVLTVISVSDEQLALHPRAAEVLLLGAPTTLALAPLDGRTTLALIDDFGLVDSAMAARVADRSAGNPRVVVELVRDLARRGWLTPSVHETRPLAELELPVSLTAVWEGQTDPDPALEVAAALGNRVVHDEWAAVCASLGQRLTEQAIASLLHGLVLRPGLEPGVYTFLQPSFRDVILRGLRPSRKVAIHTACAAVLETRGADEDRIGAHLQDAGEQEAAIDRLIAGATEAGFCGDWMRSGIALDRAQSLLDPSDPRLATVVWQRIERARTAGANDEALHHVRHLLTWARASGDPAALYRALLQRAVIRGDTGDSAGGIRDADEALSLVQTLDEEAQVMVKGWRAMVLGVAGRTREALAALREIDGVRPSEYLVPYGFGCLLLEAGEPAMALLRLDEMLAQVARRDDRLNEALGWTMRSQALRMLGDAQGSELQALRAESQLAEMRSGFVGEARIGLGLARLVLGRPEEARAPFLRALVDPERVRRMAVLGLAVVSVRTGDDEAARWLAEFEPDGLWLSLAWERDAVLLLAGLADATSDPELAERAREMAVRIDRRAMEAG